MKSNSTRASSSCPSALLEDILDVLRKHGYTPRAKQGFALEDERSSTKPGALLVDRTENIFDCVVHCDNDKRFLYQVTFDHDDEKSTVKFGKHKCLKDLLNSVYDESIDKRDNKRILRQTFANWLVNRHCNLRKPDKYKRGNGKEAKNDVTSKVYWNRKYIWEEDNSSYDITDQQCRKLKASLKKSDPLLYVDKVLPEPPHEVFLQS